MWSEMDVEALCMETEAARKKSASRTMTAPKKSDAARKRDPKGKGKAMSDVKNMEPVSQNSDERKNRRDDAEECGWNAEKYEDRLAFDFKSYRQFWDDIYAPAHGRFEDHTKIPCMRLTYKPLPYDATPFKTLEVFSVKVAEISGGLQWPLDVFGVVALRDSSDHNRNVIFSRERDCCQTLTKQNPYLLLTGPVRGAILCDPVTLEASLHVKGATEHDDKELSLLSTSFWDGCKPRASYFTLESYTSRLSTLDVGLGLIVSSVEATISVKVSSGSWLKGFCGRFIALTDSLNKEILLFDSGDKEVPLAGYHIHLSRRVVSVEICGKLRISVSASDGSSTLFGEVEFKPQETSTSSKELRIDRFCSLEVTVAWSLFSFLPASEV